MFYQIFHAQTQNHFSIKFTIFLDVFMDQHNKMYAKVFFNDFEGIINEFLFCYHKDTVLRDGKFTILALDSFYVMTVFLVC